MIDGNVPWRMHEAAVIQERGAAQFRYGNTPLSCGGREQNVQEEQDVAWLSVNQTDREMERESVVSLITLNLWEGTTSIHSK